MALSSNEYDRLLTGIKALDTRLQRVEQQGGASDVILLKLEHLTEEIGEVRRGVDKINSRVGKVENGQGQHETRITVMEHFCQDQVKPALEILTDNRIQVAGIAAKYGAGGFGVISAIGAIVFAVGKAAGWW